MPVDPNALFEAVISAVSRIPSGILVALLLGGPTAIWLVLRLVHPREARQRFGRVDPDLHWVCGECQSLNEGRSDRCYRCRMVRGPAVLPLLAGTPAADPTVVGLAVGPGMPAAPASANWLGIELADDTPDAAADTRDDGLGDGLGDAPSDATDPIAEPVPALAGPAPDARPLLEPLILEPRPKAARRRSSRPVRRD